MAYVFELTFDPITEAAVRQFWLQLHEKALPSSLQEQGYRPHISLAVYDDHLNDLSHCQQMLAQLAARTPPFAFKLSHLGFFVPGTNVAFIGVAPSLPLINVQQQLIDMYATCFSQLRPYYWPGKWTPHVTLALGANSEVASGILQLCWEMPLPIIGEAQAFHVVELQPDGARDLFTQPLATNGGMTIHEGLRHMDAGERWHWSQN